MIYSWNTVPLDDIPLAIVPRKKREKKQRDKKEILQLMCAFDIESSTIEYGYNPDRDNHHSFMYVWQFQIEQYTVVGRTWEEFAEFAERLLKLCDKGRKVNNLPDRPKMIIWVHNLAYEWQFLSGIYPFLKDDAFFMEPRKPFYCKMWECLEFRCSYRQTNLSLSALCKQYGVEEKLSGQKFNYDIVRFPDTPLSDYELEYCVRDVRSLVEAMRKRIEMSGDTLCTVPLTSTGYVRRDCTRALQSVYVFVKEMLPDEEQYKLLRQAFRGGNTHANRNYVGKILDNVISYDIASSYPTQQLTEKFPMKPFKWIDGKRCDLTHACNFIGMGYAVVGVYQFKNLRLKNKREPIPYVALAKCRTVLHESESDMEERYKTKVDNGRILEAYYCEMTLTEIDLEIVLQQYTYDEIGVSKLMVAQKDYLPSEYREVIKKYFRDKTALKGDETEEGKYRYQKSKESLNGIYGMSAQNPITEDVYFIANSDDPEDIKRKDNGSEYVQSSYADLPEDRRKELEQAGFLFLTKQEIEKKLQSAKFPYQWGVYTTAYARAQLQRAVKLAGDKIVYCDTDSIKCVGHVHIETLNQEQLKKAKEAGAFAKDKNGKTHYIGVFENDGFYEKFITQGAKRYAYISDGHMGVTVAGVTKQKNEKTGVPFAVEELKTLEHFKPGMKWVKAGGTAAVYNDSDDFIYEQDGHRVRIGRNVSIVPSTYIMTHSRDYKLLLNEIDLYGEYQREKE